MITIGWISLIFLTQYIDKISLLKTDFSIHEWDYNYNGNLDSYYFNCNPILNSTLINARLPSLGSSIVKTGYCLHDWNPLDWEIFYYYILFMDYFLWSLQPKLLIKIKYCITLEKNMLNTCRPPQGAGALFYYYFLLFFWLPLKWATLGRLEGDGG